MRDLLTNLNTVWELTTDYWQEFDERDKFIILEAHLGHDLATALRIRDKNHPPCYEFTPCEECDYFRFCLVKRKFIATRSAEEWQQNLEKFVSSFHSQST